MITLTTSRLVLSPFTESDWPFFLRLRSDPQVMRFMGPILDEEALRNVFNARREASGVFVLRDGCGKALGDIGLRISSKNPHEADVGYALLPEAQGHGYASEALEEICRYGFARLGVNAINAWVIGDNSGSSRLLEKHGFRRIQILEKAWHLDGVDYDDWIYRLERRSCPGRVNPAGENVKFTSTNP
ncbi:GNAT family N-acetyltransferase [Raoultella sp. Ech2A]|uniref:GNAT family N-acetyltransferase n=1 Tax=Raoultella TaxID=160674 RepID=UPI0005F794C7|nr:MULTISPECIES: GNAT family N-acetyltransferase [Raoultella]MDJ1653065.1 GNAT family N-acetyltransferase [Raoultella sp. Ech2A]